ncbi:MAG: MOSC domain-containing protein [Nitrospirota bacterium]
MSKIMKEGKVISVNISPGKGEKKTPLCGSGELIAGHGFKDDGHSGNWHRQVSLLAIESIEKMRKAGLEVGCGDFAENITTSEIDLPGLKIGQLIKIAETIVLKVTQIGKVCHNRCAIYYQAGDCIMPKEGIFAEVISGGKIKTNDKITIEE